MSTPGNLEWLILSGVEGTATSRRTLAAFPHDRNGFTFDGIVKKSAVILCISQHTKDNNSMTVSETNHNPCIGPETIMEAFGKGKDTKPLIVRLIWNITDLQCSCA